MEVTLEDQQNINAFNKMNSKKHELESFVKAKKVGPLDHHQGPPLPTLGFGRDAFRMVSITMEVERC